MAVSGNKLEKKSETGLTESELQTMQSVNQQEYVANHIMKTELIDLLKKYNITSNPNLFKDETFKSLRNVLEQEFEFISLNQIENCMKNSEDIKTFKDRFPCDTDNDRKKTIRELAWLFHKPPMFLTSNPRFKLLQEYISNAPRAQKMR